MPVSTDSIKVIVETAAMQELARGWQLAGRRIGVVPTMGALHDGHLSLARASLEQADETVVTIFVNPTQFAAGEDLENYPQPIENDLRLLAELGVQTVFAPSVSEMYPAGWSTRVLPSQVSRKLEGEFRPEHFGGVVTVVLKLLNLTRADLVFFGQKDFQQVAVVRQMIADLNAPVEMVVCPIVREADGLALSSRNVYLSESERKIANVLSKTLEFFEAEVRAGEQDGHLLMTAMRQMLIDGGVSSIDYAVVANPTTLEVQDEIELPAVALLATHVGKTRLIDNRIVEAK